MNPLPCVHCGEPTTDHIMFGTDHGWYGECDECYTEHSTPYCPECGREHHGGCASVQQATETVADAARRYLASLAGEPEDA